MKLLGIHMAFKRRALGGKYDVKQALMCRGTPGKMARGEGREDKSTFAMIYNQEANTVHLLSL